MKVGVLNTLAINNDKLRNIWRQIIRETTAATALHAAAHVNNYIHYVEL